ncbi:hypothetical protein BGZ63DRAFT_427671 [Mariannaea sp. PMI_226]|nr:hypothetical protein BGZ63DRAFT_427671 [Mariannaea sp. PMI_226]
MAVILNLPCEIIAMILRNLESVRDLVSPVLTCRHFYYSFLAHPDILANLMRDTIPENLLRYSVAAAEAMHYADSPSDDTVAEFVDALLHHTDQATGKLRSLPLGRALKMEQTYTVVDALVHDFASEDWKRFSGSNSEMAQDSQLSGAEYFRFCRTFYRLEMYIGLFRDKGSHSSSSQRINNREYLLYLSRLSPWEHEQLISVYDYLEVHFLRACRDILFHDVEVGKHMLDFLNSGTGWIQWSISQGLEFVYKLIHESCYDKKLAMLRSTFTSPRGTLRVAFEEYLMKAQDEMENNNNPWLMNLTVDDIKSLAPCADREDTDDGPLAAWRYGHRSWAVGGWSMLTENAGLRERAYVFWDLQRIERWKLLSLYPSIPEHSTGAFTKQEYQAIMESMRERLLIWKKGGRGYWTSGDFSRIEWPTVTA